MSIDTPTQEYARRLTDRRAVVKRLAARDTLVANLRLGVFLFGIAVAFIAYRSDTVSAWWLAVPLAAFILLILIHEHTVRRTAHAKTAAAFYERATARLEGRWSGIGDTGETLVPPHHPYAFDLDLVGTGSVFQLLNSARTGAGEATLARWLSEPADKKTIVERQASVSEMRPKLDLREELAILGSDLERGVSPKILIDWANGAPAFRSQRLRVVAILFCILAPSFSVWGFIGGPGAWPALIALSLGLVITRWTNDATKAVLHTLEEPAREFRVLAAVLAKLEQEPLQSPGLRALQTQLSADGAPASQRIYSLNRWVALHEARNNQMFAPIAILVLWDAHFAYLFEAWRTRHGRHLESWLAAVGELEALGSIATFAYERPSDVLPEIVDDKPLFDGTQVGHPLLAETQCIRNNVQLGGDVRAMIVSGSNMSGKSTLLRSVGVNSVLAMLGAPVRAAALRVSPLQIGATLRIHDSIQDGSSRFYAEIVRIRNIVESAKGPYPLLFLFDEILHGTNSKDRKTGADAILRTLLERNAIGLITTHDLSLCDTAAEHHGLVANVHFEDHLVDGKLTFDYTMRPGIVQKSNAIELMRAIGLQV